MSTISTKKLSVIALVIGVGVLAGMAVYQLVTTPAVDLEAYRKEVEAQRAEYDDYLATDKTSPFVVSGQPFEGLNYFEPDQRYSVEATVERTPTAAPMVVATTTGQDRVYERWGWAHFTLGETPLKLLLLRGDRDPDKLFVAFTDSTSARSTYGGGRYLDLEIPEGETMTLDFNLAYNPFCAYAPDYSCPIPPKENHLAVAIEAGEKDFAAKK